MDNKPCKESACHRDPKHLQGLPVLAAARADLSWGALKERYLRSYEVCFVLNLYIYIYIDIYNHNTCTYYIGRIRHICIHDIHSCIYCRYKHHYSHSYYQTSINMCVHIQIWKDVEGFRHWNDDSSRSLWIMNQVQGLTYCYNMLRAYMLWCNNGWTDD